MKFKLVVPIVVVMALSGCAIEQNSRGEMQSQSTPIYTKFELGNDVSCHSVVANFYENDVFTLDTKAVPCSSELDVRNTDINHFKDIIVLDGQVEMGLLSQSDSTEVVTAEDEDSGIPDLEEEHAYYRVAGRFYHMKLEKCFNLKVTDKGSYVEDAECFV